MLRIGLVGGVTFGHTRAFLGLFNPRTPAGEDQMPYPHTPDLPGRVVALADPARERSREYASWVEGVELVTERPEELIGKVDGVMVCGDPSPERQQWGRYFLAAGVPTFVDKPLADDAADAADLVAQATATGTPLMSASALRFSRELADLDREPVGDLHAVLGVGPEDLFLYGVHTAEFIQAALGPGVQSVQALGTPEKYHIYLDWEDGRTAVFLVGAAVQPGFRMTLLGTQGNLPLSVGDWHMFAEMLRAYCGMVESGTPPIPYPAMLETIKVLAAAQQSMENGGAAVRL